MIMFDFFHGYKNDSISANKLLWYFTLTKGGIRKCMIISIDTEKAFDKTTPIHDKNAQENKV